MHSRFSNIRPDSRGVRMLLADTAIYPLPLPSSRVKHMSPLNFLKNLNPCAELGQGITRAIFSMEEIPLANDDGSIHRCLSG